MNDINNILNVDLIDSINSAEGAPETYIGLDQPDEVIVGASKTINGLSIKRKITQINRTKMSNKRNIYIVIHYVGSVSTAANNASYFYSVDRGASANYFVDPIDIWQVVEDYDAAWHCGGRLQSNHGGTFYKKCLNSNSIGVEMCMKVDSSGNAYFEEGTVNNTIDLVKTLMNEYNIPISNVIRHYDVVGKYCPGPYIDENAWNNFKSRLVEQDHWAKQYYDFFKNNGYITSESWMNYDENVTKAETIALIDKFTGGMWISSEQDASIHWVQPHVISMCGKGYIDGSTKDQIWLTNPDALISRAILLALFDKMTGGMIDKYKDTNVDHWARRHLNSLCDKAIINSPHEWDNDFELPVNKGLFMALLYKSMNYIK